MKKTLLLTLSLFIPSYLFSQDEPTWKFEFDPSEWRLKDQRAQLYYLYGDDVLTVFDYVERKVLWELEIKGLGSTDLRTVDNYPLFWLYNVKAVEKKGSKSLLVNRYTGEILIDTENFDIDNITKYFPIYDAQALLMAGKKDKERVFALAEFKDTQLKWIIKEPAELNKITLNNNVDDYPMVNKNHVAFIYADTLYALNRDNGAKLWEKPVKETKITHLLQQPNFVRNEDENFYTTEVQDGQYTLMSYRMENNSSTWDEPYILGDAYSIYSKAGYFFARMKNSFNFINYDTGKPLWEQAPTFEKIIDDVYFKGDEYYVLFKESSAEGDIKKSLQWVNKDLTSRWEEPVAINGSKVKLVKLFDNKVLYLTDVEAGLINYNNGTKLPASITLGEGSIFTLDTLDKNFIVYQNGELHKLDIDDPTVKLLHKKIKFEGDEEYPYSLVSLEDGYGLFSDRNLWYFDKDGQLIYSKYIQEPGMSDKAKKLLFSAGGLVAGVMLREQMFDMNMQAYNEGLISSSEADANLMAMFYGGGAGTGLIGASYGGRFYDEVGGNKKKIGATDNLNHLWMVADKLDKNQFGLRIIDIRDGQEVRTIWLDNDKEFYYDVDLFMGGFMKFYEGNLLFYSLESPDN